MNKQQKEAQDPGLGTSFKQAVPRMMNEDGTFNIERKGTIATYKDVYKYLVEIKTWQFIFVLIIAFLSLNTLFTIGYLFIGIDQLNGVPETQAPFLAAFYFSAQTFTTVGYGAIAPIGNGASALAAVEAFVGLISFSIATGLVYGRFSKPSAKIAFSKNILLTPHRDKTALMFKIVNTRNSVLLNTKVHVMISLTKPNADHTAYERHYFSLPLEIDFTRYFPLTWTLVHFIDEDSPLFGMSLEEIIERDAEVLIIVEAFDETFSQNVLQKNSYAGHQWLGNVKFARNFGTTPEGKIVLNIRELDDVVPL
ncbi:MAG: ion channel [Fluviicola sp.]|jgi:inward rectifier potassium channel